MAATDSNISIIDVITPYKDAGRPENYAMTAWNDAITAKKIKKWRPKSIP